MADRLLETPRPPRGSGRRSRRSNVSRLVSATGFAVCATLFVETIAAQRLAQIPHWLGEGLPPLLGLVLFAAAWTTVWGLVGRLRPAACLTVLVLGCLALASAIKFSVRGQPLLPNEVRLASEAMQMFRWERLPFTLTTGVAAALALALLLVWAWKLPIGRLGWIRRGAVLALGVATLLAVAGFRHVPVLAGSIHYVDWSPQENSYDNGFLLGFATSAAVVLVPRPQGYSREAIAALASRHADAGPETALPARPMGLILILSESFFDPTRLPGVTFASDPAPTFHRLAEEYGSVDLITPVFGGGSCNAEFEMLTGGNMLFLPPESYPYVQFIHRPTPSLASILRDRGFATSYLQPLGASFYGIEAAAHNLGFTRFHGIDQWKHTQVSGFYVSDAATADELTDEIDRARAPFFIVVNTMEGHDPYSAGRYGQEQAGIVAAPAASRPVLESYTIAIRHADAALATLIHRLASLPDPVMVVFYGDHLPRLSDDFSPGENVYRQAGFPGDPLHSLEGRRVTAVFWTNTGSRFPSHEGPMSMCYFSPLVLERLGQPLPPFQRFLSALRRRYPVLSESGCVDASGHPVPRKVALADRAVVDYRLLAYDLLFGGQYFWQSER